MTRRLTFALALVLLLPFATTHAATVLSDRSVTVSSSTPDNTYIAGGTVQVSAPLPADLVATGGTLVVAAPVAGDALLAGGTIDVQRPITGDARIAGGKISIQDNVGGDLMIAGGYVTVAGKAKDTRIVGSTVQVTNGSNGNVVVYGADVSLAGEFNGNVEVVSSDKVSLAPGTVIHGIFKYNASQQADIPASAYIEGGVDYIGSSVFLPTAQQAKTFAKAGLWVFFLVQVTAALVVAGLIAGLFPGLSLTVVERSLTRSPERFILLGLLGFAAFVVVPIILILLLVSFVGIGLAIVLGTAYFLFLALSYVYAAILAGSALMFAIRKRMHVTWRTAILGVLVLYLVGVIPIIGFLVKVVLSAVAGGALLTLFYHYAFRRGESLEAFEARIHS